MAWSTTWAGLDRDAWLTISDKWKELLDEYQDHVVAYISGHKHTHYSWRDTPDDTLRYSGYGDGIRGVENVGHFVNGREINKQDREYPPYKLPEVYFLNPQALCFTHGKPYRAKGGLDLISSSTIYYADLINGESSFKLITRDIFKEQDVDSYMVETKFPINTGGGKIEFMESDLGMRTKDRCIEMCVDEWFKIDRGKSGRVIFQKQWKDLVDIKNIEVIQDGGTYLEVEYKGSSDRGKSWSNWSSSHPEDINTLQIRVLFKAGSNSDLKVEDVSVNTATD